MALLHEYLEALAMYRFSIKVTNDKLLIYKACGILVQ